MFMFISPRPPGPSRLRQNSQNRLYFLLFSPLIRAVAAQTVKSSKYLTTAVKACQFPLSNMFSLTDVGVHDDRSCPVLL